LAAGTIARVDGAPVGVWGKDMGDDATDDVTDDEMVASGVAEDVEAGVDVDQSRLDAIEQELADTERALARLDEGSYGRCEVCGAVIEDAELIERPATRFCSHHLPIALG
jgi:RNA polymerase-binding transcription factor DksA